MSLAGSEQVGSIEKDMEKTELEFRQAAAASDWEKAVKAHDELLRLVARLSAMHSGGTAKVFADYLRPAPEEKQEEPVSAASAPQEKLQAPEVPPAMPALDIAALEKELAELAAKMQKCLQAGDMDGMLAANMKMGELSELMAKAEQQQKAAKQSHAEPASETKAPAQASAKQGGWAAGDTLDTLTLARQRAEERKKNQKIGDSFIAMIGQGESSQAPAPEAESPGSTVDMLFNAKMKSRLSSGDQTKPKPAMTQDQLREKLEQYTFYEILSAASTSSFEELHKSFLRKIRNLNKQLSSKAIEDWQFQEFVAALCLAHDVLKYPNARLQYDLALFGEDGSGPSPEATAKQKMVPLREMLKFSTLVNARELSQAAEEKKDEKDERALGYYLVEKGLLSAEEFDSILFAQKLVSAGKLTVAQFELAMQELRENSIPLLDTLVGSEWIQPQDVFSADFL